MFISALNPKLILHTHSPHSIPFPLSRAKLNHIHKHRFLRPISNPSNPQSNPDSSSHASISNSRPIPGNEAKTLPTTKPRKPRRDSKSEAVAVEDFIRDSIEISLAAIQEQNPELLLNKENFIKEKVDDETDESETEGKEMTVEEEHPDWPLDADVGWGIRASDYFEKHPIMNVVGEDGVEIDWEGELDNNLVKEINCLEWESFAFHPSPLIVLVFERYNRATDNWKVLKELEKAAKVYWRAKDRLPPRTVKIDINIERDLAYALKVRECPQILFLRGSRILHREKKIRTADELVEMIAHFYYKARKPSWMKAVTS